MERENPNDDVIYVEYCQKDNVRQLRLTDCQKISIFDNIVYARPLAATVHSLPQILIQKWNTFV